MGKRGRTEHLSLEDGRAAASEIVRLNAGGLFDHGNVTRLPYPGFGEPPSRPPLELYYIGTELSELVSEFLDTPRVVITGPRGYGKSSDLRALSVYLYKVLTEKERLVCIWNMAAAINDVVKVVRNAILFAHLVAVAAEAAAAAEAATAAAVDNEGSTAAAAEAAAAAAVSAAAPSSAAADNTLELEAEIEKIASIGDAIEFIRRRKGEHQEVFYFFADGWELIDERDFKGESQPREKLRVYVHNQLEALFSEGTKVCLSASAKSNAVKASQGVVVFHKFKPFDDLQFAVYTSSSILRKLSKRQKDIDFYTGRVPLFLDVLCDCCIKFAKHHNDAAKQAVMRELRLTGSEITEARRIFAHFRAVRAMPNSDEETLELLEDDDNWDAVLKLFRAHDLLKQVEASAEGATVDRSCHSLEDMGKKDATYFNLQEQRYCSGYIQRIYVEAFRTKEAQFCKHAGGAWIPYCRYLLGRGDVNWSQLGWVVEDVAADVLTSREVYLGRTLGRIRGSNLKTNEFREVPKLLISELLQTMPGHGFYWKPRLFNFPYVDGVIGHVDMQGCLHITGIQVTTNVDDHLLSASLFMSYQYLKLWFPDLEAQLATKHVQLHFVYVGCSKTHKEVVYEEDKEEKILNLRVGRKSVGVAPYRWAFVPLNKALEVLDSEERELVGWVAKRRQLHLPTVPDSLAALYALKRKELDGIAVQYGLDPKHYKNKDEVITALAELVK